MKALKHTFYLIAITAFSLLGLASCIDPGLLISVSATPQKVFLALPNEAPYQSQIRVKLTKFGTEPVAGRGIVFALRAGAGNPLALGSLSNISGITDANGDVQVTYSAPLSSQGNPSTVRLVATLLDSFTTDSSVSGSVDIELVRQDLTPVCLVVTAFSNDELSSQSTVNTGGILKPAVWPVPGRNGSAITKVEFSAPCGLPFQSSVTAATIGTYWALPMRFDYPGDCPVKATVTDASGLQTVCAPIIIRVNPDAPVCNSFTADNNVVTAGSNVNFTVNSTDALNPITKIVIVTNGTPAFSTILNPVNGVASADAIYNQAGLYVASATITNSLGYSTTCPNLAITVNERSPNPPTCSLFQAFDILGNPTSSVQAGGSLVFVAQASAQGAATIANVTFAGGGNPSSSVQTVENAALPAGFVAPAISGYRTSFMYSGVTAPAQFIQAFATVTDSKGATANCAPLNITVTPAPVVSIESPAPVSHLIGGTMLFRFSTLQNSILPITISYQVRDGSAINGTGFVISSAFDYLSPAGSGAVTNGTIAIPAFTSEASLPVIIPVKNRGPYPVFFSITITGASIGGVPINVGSPATAVGEIN